VWVVHKLECRHVSVALADKLELVGEVLHMLLDLLPAAQETLLVLSLLVLRLAAEQQLSLSHSTHLQVGLIHELLPVATSCVLDFSFVNSSDSLLGFVFVRGFDYIERNQFFVHLLGYAELVSRE